MVELRNLLPGRREPVLPRLTKVRTAKVIAQQTGGEVSKILADLDAVAAGKRAAANRHAVGSLEFALRYAVGKLGMARVAEIVGVGESVLYKALNPNAAARRLPEIGFGKVVALARALRQGGHAEFFTTAVEALSAPPAPEAEGTAAKPAGGLHLAVTRLAASAGAVARAVLLATDPDSNGGETVTAADAAIILDMIARHAEEAERLRGQVLAVAGAGGAA